MNKTETIIFDFVKANDGATAQGQCEKAKIL